jgi:hypothetical protein
VRQGKDVAPWPLGDVGAQHALVDSAEENPPAHRRDQGIVRIAWGQIHATRFRKIAPAAEGNGCKYAVQAVLTDEFGLLERLLEHGLENPEVFAIVTELIWRQLYWRVRDAVYRRSREIGAVK